MIPTVEIKIFGNVYSLAPTFDVLDKIEKSTGIGFLAIIGHPEMVTLKWIKDVLHIFIGEDSLIKNDEELKAAIMSEYVHLCTQFISFIEIGFLNPNPEVKKMKESQTKEESEKKN